MNPTQKQTVFLSGYFSFMRFAGWIQWAERGDQHTGGVANLLKLEAKTLSSKILRSA